MKEKFKEKNINEKLYGIVKHGKCYILHKIKENCDFIETLCGYESTESSIENYGCLIKKEYTKVLNIKFTDSRICQERICAPIDLYLSSNLPNIDYYDKVCPECFPKGLEEEK